MKINISLNDEKSIDNALKLLKNIKKQLKEQMLEEFVVECCKAILSLSNERLQFVDVGENVKEDIISSWEYYRTFKKGNKISYILKNNAEKAVYVEFGVGIVGEENPHPNVGEAGYAYNVPSSSKLPDGSWMFSTTIEDLDLPKKDIIDYSDYNTNSLVVETKGTAATMFVYQSIIDFKDRQIAKNIWEQIKKKYWG
jgi:hypothetical protein